MGQQSVPCAEARGYPGKSEIGQPPAAPDQGRGRGGAGRDHLRHRRSYARPHLGAYQLRQRRNAPHRRRRGQLGGQLPASEVVPGVTTFDTAGHTPGHISVHISSGSEEMLLTGDVVVNSAVSFLHPEWPFGFDMDVPLATKSRMAFLDRAAADKTLVGSYHLPFPGFGHIVREGSSYRWLPADWQWTS